MVYFSFMAVAAFAVALPSAVGLPNLPFGGVHVRNGASRDIITNSYIVTFKRSTNSSVIASHKSRIRANHLRTLASGSGATGLKFDFDTPGFLGYSGSFSTATLQEIAASSEVDFIEADVVFRGQGTVTAPPVTTESAAPWGLDRMSNKSPRSSPSTYWTNSANQFKYSTAYAGTGTTIYILDSGVYTAHSEFEGRATWGYNAVNNNNSDENGHGTHCAGTAAGKTYGVAKKAKIVAVKVLDKNVLGSTSTMLAGVNWVRNNAKSGTSIMSISVAGSNSDALNAAVKAAISAGISVVVAAGNSGADASAYSPANVDSAIVVGATDTSDTKPSWSNFGPKLDIFAPGSLIQSAWLGSTTATNIMTGTSMACPHIAGLAAYLISQNGGSMSPANVASKMISLANMNMIKTPGTGSPNALAFNNF